MNNTPPSLPPINDEPSLKPGAKKPKGFFSPKVVRTAAFTIISVCIVVSVVMCILAIWDFANEDALWRMVASCVVVGGGTALFAIVNVVFGGSQDA